MEAPPCDVGFGLSFMQTEVPTQHFFARMELAEYKRNMQWVFGMQIDHIDNRLAVTAECVYASGNTELITAYNNEDCCVIWHRDKWCFFDFSPKGLSSYIRNVSHSAVVTYRTVEKENIIDLSKTSGFCDPMWIDYISRVTDSELRRSWEFVQLSQYFHIMQLMRPTDGTTEVKKGSFVFGEALPCGGLHYLHWPSEYRGAFDWTLGVPDGLGSMFNGDERNVRCTGRFYKGLLNGPGLMATDDHEEPVPMVFRLSAPYCIDDLNWKLCDLKAAIESRCESTPVLRCREHVCETVESIECSGDAKMFLTETFLMLAGPNSTMDSDAWRAMWRRVQLFCASRRHVERGMDMLPFPQAVIDLLKTEPFTLDELH